MSVSLSIYYSFQSFVYFSSLDGHFILVLVDSLERFRRRTVRVMYLPVSSRLAGYPIRSICFAARHEALVHFNWQARIFLQRPICYPEYIITGDRNNSKADVNPFGLCRCLLAVVTRGGGCFSGWLQEQWFRFRVLSPTVSRKLSISCKRPVYYRLARNFVRSVFSVDLSPIVL